MSAVLRPRPDNLSAVRVTGALLHDAELRTATGGAVLLMLDLAPDTHSGLPYTAAVDLGTDVADHMAAEAILPALSAGYTCSVQGTGLTLMRRHGKDLLRIVDPCHVLFTTVGVPSSAAAGADPVTTPAGA
jgi:hypothetical protein